MRFRPLALAAVAAVCLARSARADAPFVYTVTTTTGTPETVRVRSDNLIHATDEVILGFGRAAPLADRDVSATLNYAGVRHAVTLDLSADRTSGSLRYNLTRGPTDTFSAAGAPAYVSPARVIDDQVYSDLTDPHNRVYENLQQQLNRQSYIMPLDGNPSAATAFLADQTFRKYALVRDGEPTGYPDPRRTVVDGYGRAITDGGQFYQPVFWFDTLGMSEQTNGFDGYDLRFSFNAAGRFTRELGWSLSVPVQYRNINGAESDTTGVEFGLPVDIIRPQRRQPFGWTVTPFGEFAFSDSRDLGSSQFLFDAGVASRFTFSFGRQNREWTVAVGRPVHRLRRSRGRPWRDDDGGFDDDGGYGDDDAFRGHLAQQLVKNGVQLVRSFDYGLSADVSVTYSSLHCQRRHRPVVDAAGRRGVELLAQLRRPAGLPGRPGQPLPEPGRRLPDRLPVLNGAGRVAPVFG